MGGVFGRNFFSRHFFQSFSKHHGIGLQRDPKGPRYAFFFEKVDFNAILWGCGYKKGPKMAEIRKIRPSFKMSLNYLCFWLKMARKTFLKDKETK